MFNNNEEIEPGQLKLAVASGFGLAAAMDSCVG